MFDSHDKSFQGSLPHIATMGRDEILQQTPLKTPFEWHQTRMANGLKSMNTGF
ncbi:cag pathogenicity island protein [Helicobacter pylori]|uniref:cag pathogenicity island protein n=1 Tax=Helicobacter pylori TaxID=210 RepID=UPI0018E9F39D|nr:cag pathogenicity island protein [Helicobacter pylori]WQU59271.1 cag pathogenicity island protein [Helicobacter pylori]